MENINEETPVTEDEIQLLNRLRSSVGGPYLASLRNEQKMAFEVLLNTLRGHGQYSGTVH